MKALKAAIKNPGVDPETLLQRAAEMAQKSPEDLLEMVMDNQTNSPEMIQKQIDAKVAERLAEEKQNWERSKFADITASRKPKFTSRNTDRRSEDRALLETLAKEGFRW